MQPFFLSFVPIFVAVDALGVLPIFMGFIEGADEKKIRRVIWQSVITAVIVSIAFLLIGKAVLTLLGVTIADFMIAGGALLFVISLADLLMLEKRRLMVDLESLGAVPLGVPLIVGPAVLTTMMLLLNEHGFMPTVTAAVANIVIAGVIFYLHKPINRIFGHVGVRVISKLSHLILASIGVMMVRRGIMSF